MAIIKFKVAAKTDVGRVRTNNEDNFQVSWDLSVLPMRWINNEIHPLGEKGCLMVVADGMGGANAGEVASQIAIDSIKACFTPEKITKDVISSPENINSFIKQSITTSDKAIKEYSQKHPDTSGMGTTIVIAWILQDKLYIGWCGDSRAYIYNPDYGLVRLTKDHSYVQSLVDSGKLTEEEAFDFPDSNIITQCLSASTQKAIPETLSKPVSLSLNDIILLCTDGLCGMIRDTEIKSILSRFNGNLTETADDMVEGALRASGADNVTICLCDIVSGVKNPPTVLNINNKSSKSGKRLYYIIGFLILIIIGLILWLLLGRNPGNDKDTQEIPTSDSIIVNPPIDVEPEQIENQSEETSSSPETNKDNREDEGDKGNKILENIPKVTLPESEEKIEEISEDEYLSNESDIITITIPKGKDISPILKEKGNNSNDFHELNPQISIDSLKKNGGEIKIYKRK